MNDKLNQRINDIESSVGLLQHDFDAQKESLVWLTGRLRELEKIVDRLAAQVHLLESARPPEDPLD